MDFSLIEDEKFDFDILLSPEEESKPEDEDEDDDEIFFGPVGHTERCVASNAEVQSSKILESLDVNTKPMSPLNAEQIVEIFKEATSMAFMFKTNSETDEMQNNTSCGDIPELIRDSRTKEMSKPNEDGKENENSENALFAVNNDNNFECAIMQENKSGLCPTESGDGENFVVRRRALKERNTRRDDVASQGSAGAMKVIQRAGRQAARCSQLKKPHLISKRNNSPLKVNNMLIYGVTDSPYKDDSNMSSKETPRKTSSSSLGERSFSSTRSSSASDTSFTEESKSSKTKAPVVCRSGLKPPGFSNGRRRRTSSNSSVSSTSSTSSITAFNPNETFTVAAPSTKEPITSRKSTLQSRPTSKSSLTSIGKGLGKPTFAKPNEPSKPSGKLQPMKALPRVAAMSGNRSASASGPRSPVRPPISRRAASAGTTPGKGQKETTTPRKGGNVQRRSMCMSSASAAVQPRTPIRKKEAETSGQRNAPNSTKPSTPRNARRSIAGIPGSAGVPRGSLSSNPMEKRRVSGVPPPRDSSIKKKVMAKGDTAASGKLKAPCTPPNKGNDIVSNRKSMSASCNKRRSFLPTPNLSQSKAQSHSRLNNSFTSTSMSPAKIQLFSPCKPRTQNTSASSSDSISDPVPLELTTTFTIESEEEIQESGLVLETASKLPQPPSTFGSENNPLQENEDITVTDPVNPLQETEEIIVTDPVVHDSSAASCGATSVEAAVAHELIGGVSEPMVHDSPLMKNVVEDEFMDPFSPGLVSPDLPQEGCLNPIVLQMDAEDLIDLSHVTPKRPTEVDLIDLSVGTPTSSYEAKLVDI